MNLRRRVWLPPDGDVRLIRFQEDWVAAAGFSGESSFPPHLDLVEGRDPSGTVTIGPWRLEQGEPVLEARDDRGPVGVFRFGVPPVAAVTSRLPDGPGWAWTKGRLADLILTLGPGSDALWSWENRRGWRAHPSRG